MESFQGDDFQADDAWRAQLRRRLSAWYRHNRRDLPWRRSGDLYRIWLSEVMLQQTQVATVVGYFERFTAALPNVAALAAADEAEVLRLWEGLGYYRRARQLHQAAQQIVQRHGGRFPTSFEEVRALPGVGRYTAGAILSIGLDQPHPIVEANTLRLYSRLLMMREDPRRAAGQRRLWAFAEWLLPKRGAGELNQALMELGSEICTPQQPQCDRCPLAELCPTHRHHLQEEIPLPPPRTRYTELLEAAVVVRRGDQVLVRQCGADERWAGMWDFLRFEISSPTPTAAQLRAGAQRLCPTPIASPRHLTTLKHGVTRYRITLQVYEARLRRGYPSPAADNLKWADLSELNTLPLSVTGRKIAGLVGP